MDPKQMIPLGPRDSTNDHWIAVVLFILAAMALVVAGAVIP